MKIKGIAVKSIQRFVETKYSERYEEWLNLLPEPSKKIFEGFIIYTKWYDLKLAQLDPIKTIATLFYDGNEQQAFYELGIFGAKFSLNSFYKAFVKIASPEFVMKRTADIFSAFFSEGKFKITQKSKQKVVFTATGFKNNEVIVFYRVAGWIFELFEQIDYQAKNVEVVVRDKEDDFVEIDVVAYWD